MERLPKAFMLVRSQHQAPRWQFAALLLGLGPFFLLFAWIEPHPLYWAAFIGAGRSNSLEGLLRGSVMNVWAIRRLRIFNFADLIIYSFVIYLVGRGLPRLVLSAMFLPLPFRMPAKRAKRGPVLTAAA